MLQIITYREQQIWHRTSSKGNYYSACNKYGHPLGTFTYKGKVQKQEALAAAKKAIDAYMLEMTESYKTALMIPGYRPHFAAGMYCGSQAKMEEYLHHLTL